MVYIIVNLQLLHVVNIFPKGTEAANWIRDQYHPEAPVFLSDPGSLDNCTTLYYIVIMKRDKRLVWDKWNLEHIKKHKVTKQEVEEAYQSKDFIRQSYLERLIILGKTRKRRLLTKIISYAKQINPYVVSARDMSKKERRFYEKSKTNKTI